MSAAYGRLAVRLIVVSLLNTKLHYERENNFMARAKKTSKTVEDARGRLAGLKAIDANLDLGNGITLKGYEKRIGDTDASLETYNTTLSLVDEQKNVFETNENDLKDYHERILLGVGSKFGKNSVEYEKAGGTKKSERKKPVKVKEKA